MDYISVSCLDLCVLLMSPDNYFLMQSCFKVFIALFGIGLYELEIISRS